MIIQMQYIVKKKIKKKARVSFLTQAGGFALGMSIYSLYNPLLSAREVRHRIRRSSSAQHFLQ